jgi:hypothetical protein
MRIKTVTGPASFGLFISDEWAWMKIGSGVTGVVPGDCLVIDESITDATLFVFTTMKEAGATDASAETPGKVGVAMDTGTAGDVIRFSFGGLVQAKIAETSLATGTELVLDLTGTNRRLEGTVSVVEERLVGTLMQATTTTNQVRWVQLDGLNGIGVRVA